MKDRNIYTKAGKLINSVEFFGDGNDRMFFKLKEYSLELRNGEWPRCNCPDGSINSVKDRPCSHKIALLIFLGLLGGKEHVEVTITDKKEA